MKLAGEAIDAVLRQAGGSTVPGLVAAALAAGGNDWVSLLRTFAGAAFLGSVTDAMLLGHWYLVQPGLPRRLLNEMVSPCVRGSSMRVSAQHTSQHDTKTG